MSMTFETARILIASDAAAAAARILAGLADEFDDLRISTNPELAVQEFEAYGPSVLVLAFAALARARQHCPGLDPLDPATPQNRHRNVILCHRDELRSVIELCRQEVFDDYVARVADDQASMRWRSGAVFDAWADARAGSSSIANRSCSAKRRWSRAFDSAQTLVRVPATLPTGRFASAKGEPGGPASDRRQFDLRQGPLPAAVVHRAEGAGRRADARECRAHPS